MVKPIRYWFAGLCALFVACSAYSITVSGWTNVYWGVNGWLLQVPDLQISVANHNYYVSYQTDTNYIIKGSSSLNGPWSSEPGSKNGALTTTSNYLWTNQRYFRLSGPRAYIPIFSFAIFYNHELEFTWAAPMIINGPVHANGPIYTGISPASSLTYNSTVTAGGTISKKALGGYTVANMTGPLTYNGTPPYVTNTYKLQTYFDYMNQASIPTITEIPPAAEDPNSMAGQERLFNQACLILLVSNTSVSFIIRTSVNDSSPITLTCNTNNVNVTNMLVFLCITNTFYDARESKSIKVTQIDVGLFKAWAATNQAVKSKEPFLPVIYVADRRTVTPSQMDAVRLVNGAQLPVFQGFSSNTNFTLVTLNPLYIRGNYNCPNSADLGTTNTASAMPSALICDALTVLSPSWSDANSFNSLSSRNPTATTVNSAIMAGTVYTTGTDSSTFSGGVHNFPRLLENWSISIPLTINGSLVNLYASVYATNQFQLPGNYYNAPKRQFSFDQRFSDPAQLPPATPLVGLYLP